MDTDRHGWWVPAIATRSDNSVCASKDDEIVSPVPCGAPLPSDGRGRAVHPEVVGHQSASVGGPERDRSPVAAAARGDSAPMVRERVRPVRLLPAGTAGGRCGLRPSRAQGAPQPSRAPISKAAFVRSNVPAPRREPRSPPSLGPRLLTSLGCVLIACATWAAEAPPGQHHKLTDGALFVPAGFACSSKGEFDLTLHLHGAAQTVEQNFVAARYPGVLANVTLPGLSAVYTGRFQDTNTFWRILRETEAQLKTRATTGTPAPRVGRVTITSFSAGFGGVRELLRDPGIFARIDTLVMADSIYAGFAGDPAERRVNPANMEGFLNFAREAAAGRRRLLISHSQLPTPSYASTVETADYLIAQLGGRREATTEDWPDGLRLRSQFRRGRCEILGFDGDTGADHMQHLRQLRLFFERIKR